jgi:hypothetical protein
VLKTPTIGTIWMGASNARILTRFSESHRAVARTLPLPGPSFGIELDTRSHTVFALNLRNHLVRFYRYPASR